MIRLGKYFIYKLECVVSEVVLCMVLFIIYCFYDNVICVWELFFILYRKLKVVFV